ncbi:MAG: acyltransferase family protein [Candidatus Thorarchaeota archaeon]
MERTKIELNPQYEYNFDIFFRSINSIKALSILGVILGHLLRPPKELGFDILYFWYPGGVGLNIFVFLSGFLLMVGLLRKNKEEHSWVRWYKTRIMRIFLLFIISTLVTLLVRYLVYEDVYSLNSILIHMGGTGSTPNNPDFFLIDPHHWYITLILSCYLLFPVFYYLIKKNCKIMLILSISFFILYSFLFQLIPSMMVSITYLPRYFLFIFGMIFGFWIGKDNLKNLNFFGRNRKAVLLLSLSFNVLLFFSIFFHFYSLSILRVVFLSLISIVITLLLIFFFKYRFKTNKILNIVGNKTYEIYLFQFLIIILIYRIDTLLNGPASLWLIFIPLTFILSILIAYPFYYLGILVNKAKSLHSLILVICSSFIIYGFIANIIDLFYPTFLTNYIALIIFGSLIIPLLLIHYYKKYSLKKSLLD